MHPLKFAYRSLTKTRGFSAVTILTLALGIGATTAIFSVVNAVVLRPLGFPRPDQLVAARCVIPKAADKYPTLPVNARFYTEWRACPAFSSLALFERRSVTLTGAGEPIRLAGMRSTSNLFVTLGIAPTLGRGFADDDDQPGKATVAVISDRLWHQHFAADPGVLGRTITINARPVTVVGVLPPSFSFPDNQPNEPDLYLPETLSAQEISEIIGRFNYEVIGRLAPGRSIQDAEAQINVVAARLSNLAHENVEIRGKLTALHDTVVGPVRRGVWILFGAISAVLLLACLNLSLLGLARAESRRHDFAVQAALGAPRRRLFVQTLTEYLALAFVGGLLGCLLAWWGVDALVRLAPVELPRLGATTLDLHALLFAIGATSLATLFSGLLPAWYCTRRDHTVMQLARGGPRTTGSRGARRLRHTFIALEIGVSTFLLAAAALLVGSFVKLMQADVGFHAPRVITTTLMVPTAKYVNRADRTDYYRRVLTAVSGLPGVSSAAVSTALPLTGETWIDQISIPSDNRPGFERPSANVRFVSPDYFTTLGIPLLAGRSFRDDDSAQAIVVSARLAATLWPGQDPLGRKATRGNRPSDQFNVIGVVGDVRADIDHRPVNFVYRPHWAWGPTEVNLTIRSQGAPTGLAAAIRRAVHQVDADVPLQTFRTMDDILTSAVAQRAFEMRLITTFALSALALAGLGIYGVVAQSVGQRTRELGIRLAFGASPAALCRMVVRQGFGPITLGLIAGLTASWFGGQVLTAFLYETSPRDPFVFGLVTFVLILVAFFACWLPARRATRVDPLTALRAE